MSKIVEAMDLMCNEICKNLPQDWLLTTDFEEGALEIMLYDPDGDKIKIEDDHMPPSYRIMSRINLARLTDGLTAAYDDLDTDPSWNFKCD